MKKTGSVYKKDGIDYLVVDNDLIRKFEFKDNDAYYNHNGTTYSLGVSNNTVDVSNVTDMYGIFHKAHKFNADISKWDVSNVTKMDFMFLDAHKFNADISKWNVSNVTNMFRMFSYAFQFNTDISNWDVSSVVDMGYVFEGKTINDINNHNIPKWYTDRHQKNLTIAKQKRILEKYKDLPDEDKKAILKIFSLGLNQFKYKNISTF